MNMLARNSDGVESQLLSHQDFEAALTPHLDLSLPGHSTKKPGVLIFFKILFLDVIYRVGGIESIVRMRADFADCLREVFGEETILGQLDGGGIGAMAPNVSIPDLEERFGLLRARCADIGAVSIDGEIKLNYAAGLTVVNGTTWDPSELVCETLVACQTAENLGPFARHTYNPAESDDTDFARVVMWIPRLQQAVDGQTMTLHQQTIVPVQPDSSLPVLREYLVRVPDDEGKPVDADSFIDIAEKYQFVGQIDRWVFGKAISLMKQGVGIDTRTFINLSAYSLQDSTFLDFVSNLMDDGEVDGTLLGFEVTESSMIRDLETAATFLRAMKDRGCDIALDDFGTGYSSLEHLKSLPVDMIKLDGEFIRSLPDDPMSVAITEASVRFARVTNKIVVAEFVENERIFNCIRELGIDYGQGYQLARPVPVEDPFKTEI